MRGTSVDSTPGRSKAPVLILRGSIVPAAKVVYTRRDDTKTYEKI